MYPNAVVEHFLGKCLAVLVALIYVGWTATGAGLIEAVMMLLIAIFPLMCIWFPGEMASHARVLARFSLFQRAPAFLIRSFGWVFLVVILGLTTAVV